MWYWILRFEGILLLPVALIYYVLCGVPFTLRCTRCRQRLFDPAALRGGLCESCHKEKLADMTGFYTEQYENTRPPTRLAPDKFFPRVEGKIGRGRIIDVGCGLGYFLFRLASPERSLFGIDVGHGALRIARNWVKEGNFCRADVTRIPYESNSFDYLVCTEVLEHLTPLQGAKAVRECFRVLKPGGVAVFTVPNGKGALGDYFYAHIRFFSFASVTALLKGAGFELASRKKFGLYLAFVSRFIGFLYTARGMYLPFPPILNITVPEPLATTFFLECVKPVKGKPSDYPANKVEDAEAVYERSPSRGGGRDTGTARG
jgi:SAM-dependent methyltransferase